MWKIGPFDINAASAEDFDELPGVGPVIAAKIVAGQPHWISVDALTNIDGVSAEMVAGWGEALFWDAVTYEAP
jgi:competence protein ComEA